MTATWNVLMSLCPLQIGLEMLVSHPGNDPSKWGITQIFYNGQMFSNTTQLNTAFADTTSSLDRQQVSALSLRSLTRHGMICLPTQHFLGSIDCVDPRKISRFSTWQMHLTV